jgi:hypothetical protein
MGWPCASDQYTLYISEPTAAAIQVIRSEVMGIAKDSQNKQMDTIPNKRNTSALDSTVAATSPLR